MLQLTRDTWVDVGQMLFFGERLCMTWIIWSRKQQQLVQQGCRLFLEHRGPSDAVARIDLHQLTDAPGSADLRMDKLKQW